MSGHCKHCGYDHCQCDEIEKDLRRIEKQGFIPTDDERAANRKAVMALSKRERFETLLGHPKTIMSDTPTPRTDAKGMSILGWNPILGYRAMAEHAQDLETELTSARQEIERLQTNGIHSCHDQCQRPNCVLRRELKAVTEQRDRLKEWKESAIAVEKEWDAQAVGTLLNIKLGDSIRANIEPKIREIIEQRDRLAEVISEIARGELNWAHCVVLAREALQSLDQNETNPAAGSTLKDNE